MSFIGQSIGTFVVEGNLAHLITLVMVGFLGLTVLAGLAYSARFVYGRQDWGDAQQSDCTENR